MERPAVTFTIEAGLRVLWISVRLESDGGRGIFVPQDLDQAAQLKVSEVRETSVRCHWILNPSEARVGMKPCEAWAKLLR